MIDPTISLVGFLVGFLVGLTGIGGGALLTPFLIMATGTRPVVAVGTDLVYSAVTKLVGAVLHARQGTVDFEVVRRLAFGSIPSGLAAVLAIRHLSDAGVDMDVVVRHFLGGVLVVVAVIMLTRLLGVRSPRIPGSPGFAMRERGAVLAGCITGALVGFTSVGSGALLLPFLVSLYPLDPARVVGTDMVHAAILVTIASLAHAHAGTVDWPLAGTLVAGSVPGVAVGTWVAPRLSVNLLRAGLASLLLLTGLTLM